MATTKAENPRENDDLTRDMFNTEEKDIINAAFDTYQATLKRRANAESNPQIKQIRENDVRRAAAVLNKLQGI